MFAAGKTSTSAAAQLYVDDVFSTYLYTGNSSTQTINNGVNLSTYGGLVWIKDRSAARSNYLVSTASVSQNLSSDTTGAYAFGGLNSFSSTGFVLDTYASSNQNNETFVSWTFRKAPKFFDVVTWTGDGVAGRQITHSLGQVPGMIVMKCTAGQATTNWFVYHRSLGATQYVLLNSTASVATSNLPFNNTEPTASVFTIDGSGGWTQANATASTYVAYLFAHDTSTDGFIQCGSYGSGALSVNLGWEPQWILVKNTSSALPWVIYDNMRGLGTNFGEAYNLQANASSAEADNNDGISITSTGFNLNGSNSYPTGNTGTYIYIAIRRPNKPPTTGTQVFMPTVYTGTNVNNRLVNTTIAPDMVFVRQRDDATLAGMVVGDRLRGQPYLLTGGTAAEVTSATALDQQLVSATEYGTAFSAMNGFWVGTDATAKLNVNTTASNHIAEAFKRAPGVFDEVCYTGTGSATTVAHNLGVAPELMLIKRKNVAGDNFVAYCAPAGTGNYAYLTTMAFAAADSGFWNSTVPTASVFSLGNRTQVNGSSSTYVAYLFASLPGISKVFSYTGNGSSQTINCGFSTGARFVLIKRTDSTGDWYVWDSARGIVAGNDPHLSLNSTAAEVTTDDSVDTDNTGFIVNQVAATNVNVTSATYIGLAVS